MADLRSLLPPNATRLERALDLATARIADIPVPLADLWDPATCPIDQLPWLAWSLAAEWSADWTEAQKRGAVADAIALHRIKGTPASVRRVLERFDAILELVEGWQSGGDPYTFEVRLPLDAASGAHATAAFADAIIRDVARVKPVRAHFRLVQTITATAAIGIVAAARAARFDRREGIATPDADPVWLTYLETEEGEPMTDQAGAYLVHA